MKNKEELTNLSFFETTGSSMWPFLRAGEKLIIKRTPTEDLKIGDIIIYRGKSQLVCHRLIKKIKEKNKKAIIYVTANEIDEALDLYDQGADYVILAHFLGGEHVSLLIEDYMGDIKNVLNNSDSLTNM